MSDGGSSAADELSPAARKAWSDIQAAGVHEQRLKASDALAREMTPGDIDPLLRIGHRGTPDEQGSNPAS